MNLIQRELSRTIPKNVPRRFYSDGVPILSAFGCALLERDTGKSVVYTAVNLSTGAKEVLRRQSAPMTTSQVTAMLERMRTSSVAGAGCYEADRAFGQSIRFDDCVNILRSVFEDILPQIGYAVRGGQVALAHHILQAIEARSVSLAEAEVGTGKTLAYLVPAILARRGRLNDHRNMELYPNTRYKDTAQMPIVVATSSIALQKAIVTDYIPELSGILMEHGIIKTPLTAVIRKGREHYLCQRNLNAYLASESDRSSRTALSALLLPDPQVDLTEVDGMSSYLKRRIAVPQRCPEDCLSRTACAYRRFLASAKSPAIDIQVCNHNYLLADLRNRRDGRRPLIPNYQSVIIDEAHKFLSAARSMYGLELENTTPSAVRAGVSALSFKSPVTRRLARKTARALARESDRLFRSLQTSHDDDSDHPRRSVAMDSVTERHIRNVAAIADDLLDLLALAPIAEHQAGLKEHLRFELCQICDTAFAFRDHHSLVCWTQHEGGEETLCAIPKDLDKRLYEDFWSQKYPIILTSGTLSASGDFTHIRRTLGIERVGARLTETATTSPFDHHRNTLLYLSNCVPFPDQRSGAYITAVADETERLIRASCGHAAVLFTSYKVMDRVWELLKEKELPYPMFRMDKGGHRAIERFKKSGDGVLFAAGSLWEGIDIPGDTLSMLIIVKLPFATPDPIGEYEQTLYQDMGEYKRRVIVPEMLIKLKQGTGRLIRTETDTGVVAILDCRAAPGGAYHSAVLTALPPCRVTQAMSDVASFFKERKPSDYFAIPNLGIASTFEEVSHADDNDPYRACGHPQCIGG